MFEKLTDRIFAYPFDGYTDRPNIGLVIGERYTLLYDGGNSEAHVRLIQSSMQKQGLPMPDFCCLSHWHWDHSFGAGFWNVPVIAGRETHEQLQIVKQWKWDDASMDARVAAREDIVFCSEMIRREYPDRAQIRATAADIVFDGTLTLELGGLRCQLISCCAPHSSDSVLCYIPEERFLFLGDSSYKDLYGKEWEFSLEHEEDFGKNTDAIPYDREKVEDFLTLLKPLDFTHCIGGHAPVKSKEALIAELTEGIGSLH